jgi:multidrug resistance efflux pump
MKRTTLGVGAALVIVAAINFGLVAVRRGPVSAALSPSTERSGIVAAGPGRVEAVSEEVRVSAQVSGRLQAVLVEENDRISAGQLVATIDNADYRARVASAEAMVRLREAEAHKVHNGARAQERRDAEAAVREAAAVVDNAQADVGRRRDLYRDAVISRAEIDKAEEAFNVSRAKLDSARERLSLLDAGSRDEDRARADAEVALARAALDEARAVLQKTFIRAPIGGVVLRKHRRAGESVSTQFESPVLTIADRSRLRGRDGRRAAPRRTDRLRDRRRVRRAAIYRPGGAGRTGARPQERAYGRTDGARGHESARDADRADRRPRAAARPPRAGIHPRREIKNRRPASAGRPYAFQIPTSYFRLRNS